MAHSFIEQNKCFHRFVRFSTSGQAKITGIQVLAQSSGMTLVEMGKRLLDASKLGDTDTVRTLMSSGAPFTTDWVGRMTLLAINAVVDDLI